MDNRYGICDECGCDLTAVWFKEKESVLYNGTYVNTGRERNAVDYLMCPHCLKSFPVDDSFDEPFH